MEKKKESCFERKAGIEGTEVVVYWAAFAGVAACRAGAAA